MSLYRYSYRIVDYLTYSCFYLKELKELEEDLKIRKEKIQFMNREALHARKTFRRKVAQNLMNYQWYYSFENRKKISLEKGWDYYGKSYILARIQYNS